MKQVVLYMDHEWALGSIHHELCKYLFKKEINARVLPWAQPYSQEEMQELDKTVEIYMTTPQGYAYLVQDFKIDPQKILVVAHSVLDLTSMIRSFGLDGFSKAKKYAVVSQFLKSESNILNIKREPEVLPLGINTSLYSGKISPKLQTVGFASSYHHREDPADGNLPDHAYALKEMKRGYLVAESAAAAGLDCSVAQLYHHSYVTMPGYYDSVDCIVISSTQEGAGLPMLEAAAAGKLVITTPVGHWEERAAEKGGLNVPIHEEDFLNETIKLLKFYKRNPKKYKEKCREILEHSKSYDWSKVIDQWAAFIEN